MKCLKKTRKYIKVSISLLILIALIIGNIQLTYASSTVDISKMNLTYDITIDESSKIDLYGNNDEVIAQFYKLKDGGYIIIDSKTNDYIEYSTESDNLFITNPSAKYFYGGALNYFEEVSPHSVKELSTQAIFDKEVATIQKNDEKIISPIPQTRTLPAGTYSHNLSYKPKTYDTNTKDNCGSTAAAILLAYYYDHVSTVYVDKNLITSDGNALTKKLISYIEPSGGGSTYTSMVNGLNNYLGSRGISRTAESINLVQGAETIYNGHCPIIAGVTRHPTYGEHWVVAYGFNITNLLVKSFTVNNGWGQNGIVINSQYLDGAICI